ncbi:hypothetical protein JTB14_022662 [Gonioctena quinquepunctata]|nr:hypothetical protein JTB14_022662 [Gonioctena quinquepunctata]
MAKRFFKKPLPFTMIGMTEEYNELEVANIPSDIGSENDSDGDNDCEITTAEAEFNFDGDNRILSDREDETPLPMDTWDPEDLLPLSQLKAMGKIQWCKIHKITPPEDFKEPFGVAQDIKDLGLRWYVNCALLILSGISLLSAWCVLLDDDLLDVLEECAPAPFQDLRCRV